MKKLFSFLILLFIGLMLNGCSDHQLLPLKPSNVIVAFGDSLTSGVGVKVGNSYPAQLSEISGFEIVNAGKSGDTSEQGLKRLDEALNRYKPKLVILLMGGNDFLQKVSVSDTKANLALMIEKTQSHGSQILLVGVPEKKLFSDTAELYVELSNEYKVPLEESIVASLMVRASMKSDYVHFNEQGYRALAEAIYNKLKEVNAL